MMSVSGADAICHDPRGTGRGGTLGNQRLAAPRRGAFCIARVSEGRSPDDPGNATGPPLPSTPLGVGRSRRASGGSDTLSGSHLSVTSRETRGLRHFVPRHPCYERGTPTGVLGRACSLVGRVGRPAPIYWLTPHVGIRKDARSIGIGRGTKCR